MNKKVSSLILVVFCIVLLCSCDSKEASPNETEKAREEVEVTKKDSQEEEKWDLPPMIMVDGELYQDSGKIQESRKCGTHDGEITSSVDASEKPSENNQSNFGEGYGYQFYGEDEVHVHIDNKWCIFKIIPSSLSNE